MIKKYIVSSIFILLIGSLATIVYSTNKSLISIYENAKTSNTYLAIFNQAEQLKSASLMYISKNNSLPEESFISTLINNKLLVEEAITLEKFFVYNRKKNTIEYTARIDCNFIFNNLYKYIHQKIKDNEMSCENNTLTYFI